MRVRERDGEHFLVVEFSGDELHALAPDQVAPVLCALAGRDVDALIHVQMMGSDPLCGRTLVSAWFRRLVWRDPVHHHTVDDAESEMLTPAMIEGFEARLRAATGFPERIALGPVQQSGAAAQRQTRLERVAAGLLPDPYRNCDRLTNPSGPRYPAHPPSPYEPEVLAHARWLDVLKRSRRPAPATLIIQSQSPDAEDL